MAKQPSASVSHVMVVGTPLPVAKEPAAASGLNSAVRRLAPLRVARAFSVGGERVVLGVGEKIVVMVGVTSRKRFEGCGEVEV